MTEPASIIIRRCHRGLLTSASESSELSSSPFIDTKPPIGSRRREYDVPFFFEVRLMSFGPIPIENSRMQTPKQRAAVKCPSSCTNISTPNTSSATRIEITTEIASEKQQIIGAAKNSF